MANGTLTNFWKSTTDRINEYEELMKKYNKFDEFRAFFVKQYKMEYQASLLERMSLDHNNPMYITPINVGMMVDMTNFIHKNILDDMPLADLIKFCDGTRFKGYVENYIVQDIMNIIRAENDNIDMYIAAEPTLAEDDYWEEYATGLNIKINDPELHWFRN